jgi:hypothetical protein
MKLRRALVCFPYPISFLIVLRSFVLSFGCKVPKARGKGIGLSVLVFCVGGRGSVRIHCLLCTHLDEVAFGGSVAGCRLAVVLVITVDDTPFHVMPSLFDFEYPLMYLL